MFSLKGNTTAVIYFLFLINNFIFQVTVAQIVGGVSTTIEELPFIVSLRLHNEHFCGGSIISVRHVLTAAHCLINHPPLDTITVVAGSTRSYGRGGMVHRISRIIFHPGYTHRPADNHRDDIAVAKLSSDIQFGRSSQKINLPSRYTRSQERAMISGWGTLSESDHRISPILQRAYVTVIGNPICSVQLRAENVHAISDGQICALERRGVGTCMKDSGGPLTANDEIIGIVSFGIPCGRGLPDVFTRVYTYKSWIESVMASS